MTERKEVWVFRTGSLGDALVALPAVQRVRELHPAADLVLLTNDPGGPIVDAWDILRHSGAFARAEHYTPGSLRSLFDLVRRIRRARPAALYYLAPTRRSRFQLLRDRICFGLLGGIPAVRGLDRSPPPAPVDASVPVSKEADRLLHLVDPAASAATLSRSRLLEVPEGAREASAAMLRDAGWSEGQPLVAIAAGSKMPAKRWAAARYRETGDRLLRRRPDAFLVLLGSADEAAVADEIAAGWPPGRSANLAGRTSLIESAAVLERARLYLGNDTGTMHLAAAMGTPCVAIFSARDQAGKWEPFGESNRVLRARVECAGCLLLVCEDRAMECLSRVGVDEVEAAASPYLESAR
jgi:ADP-heptose:LPS heptosyltransferase